MEVFELSEVAKILEIPKSRVKNWTIGRPLTIAPSVRSARGTGSRNLYTREDIYLLAIANELLSLGFKAGQVQKFLNRLRRQSGRLGKDIHTILIYPSDREWQWFQLKNEQQHFDLAKIWFKRKGIVGMYWLNVLRLIARVDRNIMEREKVVGAPRERGEE